MTLYAIIALLAVATIVAAAALCRAVAKLAKEVKDFIADIMKFGA